MIQNTLLIHLTLGTALLFAIQTSAQTTLEFDARLDAATVLTNPFASSLNYSGAIPGLRASFSMLSVNQVAPKTSFLYGISYASSGFNRGNFWLCGNSFDNVNPETQARIFENLSHDSEQVDHLSLPLGMRRILKQGKKWTVYGQATLEPMLYIRTKYANHRWDPEHVSPSSRSLQAKEIQLAAGAAAGFERRLLDAWTLAFRPTLRVHLTNAAKNMHPIEGNAKHATLGIAFAVGHSF